MKRIASRLAIVVAASLGAAGAVVGISAASSTATPYTYYACQAKSGNISDITTWSGLKCSSDDTRVTWNSMGPQGPNGQKGAPGAPGQRGPQGPAGAPAVNPNVLYDSMTVSSNYQWSQCFTCVQMDQFGNDVTMANGGGTLRHVLVSMSDWDAASNVQPISLTLTLYNESASEISDGPSNGQGVGSEIASSTVTVTPAASVSGCNNGYVLGCAPNFNVSFPFDNVSLGSNDVIYDLSYDNNTIDTGLNVNMSYESSSVPSAGADSLPGWLWAATDPGAGYGDAGGPHGEVTCSTAVDSTFELWSTAESTPGDDACGAAATPVIVGNLVPAVEFLSN